MRALLIVLFLLIIAPRFGSAGEPFELKHFDTKFDYVDFPAGEIFHGKRAPVDYKSHRLARVFRTVITEGAKEAPNFAGHYTFMHWGCGSNCSRSAIVDAKTGKVYEGPVAGNGFDFRLDSRLLKVSPPDSDGNYADLFYTIPELYVWNEKLKKLELVQKAE